MQNYISKLEDADSTESLFKCATSKQYSKSSIYPANAKADTAQTNSNISPVMVTGSLANEIHRENMEKLKQMSNDEIMLEKGNLETMLDPSTIAFIKSMKDTKDKTKTKLLEVCKNRLVDNKKIKLVEGTVRDASQEFENPKMEVDDESIAKASINEDIKQKNFKMETDFTSLDKELPEPVVDIVKTAEKSGWVHMDDLEPEKVKWMQDLTENEDTKLPEEPYNARFDFNGILMPYKDEILTVDKGLHHHGEEPNRPGYSVQELLQLSRSFTQQQRCTALTTLANIMEKTHQGWYDRALKPPLLETLNQRNILLLLRFSLDDTALPVITASLQAIRGFLFCETDELCLDKMFGIDNFVEPMMKPSMKDVDNIDALKDYELAQLDTVAVLVRTDIVLRIRYIMSEVQLSPVGMTSALEILARLARHSQAVASNIACTPNLLNYIVKKCIPLSMNKSEFNRDSSKAYKCPLVAAVRLCRILITYAGLHVAVILKDLRIIHSLLTYICSDASRQEVRLHIESLRLWRLFLHYDIEKDSIIGARLTLISQLRLLATTLDIDVASPLTCDYAAALIAIAKYDEPLKQHVAVLLAKWSTQLSTISMPNWNNTVLIAETLRTLGDVSSFQRNWITNSRIFMQLSSFSNLLCGLENATDRDPSSLPTLGSMTYEGKLQPILSINSIIIFLKTTLECLLKHNCSQDIERILRNTNVQNYLQRLKNSEWSLERSWYTRPEYSLLITIIKAENHLNAIMKGQLSDTVWKIAIKLISALPADCTDSTIEVLNFSLAPERINLRFLESGLEKLELSDNYKRRENLDNSSIVVEFYIRFLSINGSWHEAGMPKDWLYLPLVDYYTRLKSKQPKQSSDTLEPIEILTLLKLELIMPELTQNLTPNLRFSRMLLLYLCETTFVHPPESELPEKIISLLVRGNYKKFDLSSEVPGLSSFTDLFTALCENFLANSYGQDCFAQIVLVFVAQRYEVHYRKLLWSEHAGVLQYCRLTPDKLLIPYEEYLYPVEIDTSLIEAYITALVRESVRYSHSPVLYNIALHHSAMYLKETSKLAVLMRSRIGRLMNQARTRVLAEKLLNYEPSVKAGD
ncbi:PREDICTED: RNA polymerase II-associated protein 1 [Ceratosolen solmsi marchali]|uniref:RNA polymerase II-associated protein 1 n=1 Tax=Ceratosolen solmsi marchali TaxID=326594 RepID=A0AAJ7DWH0_9HYME|nr:PREDICTED: RNA polymerase II-associated protein 1 [Ceratosolen solmsi marchali]